MSNKDEQQAIEQYLAFFDGDKNRALQTLLRYPPHDKPAKKPATPYKEPTTPVLLSVRDVTKAYKHGLATRKKRLAHTFDDCRMRLCTYFRRHPAPS